MTFKIKNNIEKSEWENDFYNKKVLEKNKKGVAILRNGCQGINDKFLPKHLKKLESLSIGNCKKLISISK